MDGPGIDQKIRYGYAKAAQHLGQDFELYRSSVPVDPISPGNLIGTIKCVATTDWEWMKSNKPGNALYWLVIDGQTSSLPLSANEGDYLVGDHTYFVYTKEFQMPMSGMQCNSVISIVRATQSIAKGNQGYIAYAASGTTPVFTNMPACVLKDSKGKDANSKLPTDTIQPEWIVFLPNLGGVKVITGDFMIDQDGAEYVLSVHEETSSGWRLTARQTTNK